MPLVETQIAGHSRWLLFDTGNMVGLSLTKAEIARQSLAVDAEDRLPSNRLSAGSLAKLLAPSVVVFRRKLTNQPVYEIDDNDIVLGLV